MILTPDICEIIMASDLVFLSCGGTVEKIYLEKTGLLGFDQSRVSDWLNHCRIAQPWRTETVLLMDSLDMTDAHRQLIAEKIRETPETRIVVIHGTDTMVETAQQVLLRRNQNQVVVFTGAMIPACLEQSDARFNLGMATAAVQCLAPGVYIAMSGGVWPADQVIKNRERGCFEGRLKGRAEDRSSDRF
jgi:L-asparaginase